MTRDEVYKEIDRERAYQATLDHTRTDGCAKSVGDYINLLGYYADEARKEWTINAGTLHARHMIRKLAACAVACLENHDCPQRLGKDGNSFQLAPGELATRRTDFPCSCEIYEYCEKCNPEKYRQEVARRESDNRTDALAEQAVSEPR